MYLPLSQITLLNVELVLVRKRLGVDRKTHQLIIIDNSGYKVRGEIISVGEDANATEGIGIVLRTYDWLDFGTYQAFYITPKESLQGSYEVWSSTIESNEDIIVNGQFRRESQSVSNKA